MEEKKYKRNTNLEQRIVHLNLSFKDCSYLQVHQLKSFQIQIQLVYNKIEGVSPWKSQNHIYKETLSWNFKS